MVVRPQSRSRNLLERLFALISFETLMSPDDLVHPHKYAQIEVERRFLVRALPDDLDPEGAFWRMIDLYISDTRLRLRRIESPSGDTLALKLGQKYPVSDQGARRTMMTTIYLNEAEYSRFATLGGATLVKRRYPYRYGGEQYNLDVFEGHLSGLILLEIESHNVDDLDALPVPSFAVREVTDEPFFTGGGLAKMPPKEFQRALSKRI